MADTPSVAEVLEQAAELLSKPGAWTQGRLSGGLGADKCFCALGALIEVSPVGFSAAEYLEKMLPRVTATDAYRPLAKWNDTPGRTQEEVVAKLREAAALARAEQVA